MNLDRRRDLLRILREGRAASQHEIAAALRRAGHEVTQATVSRDLAELGAVKIRTGTGLAYRLPEEAPRPGADLTSRTLAKTLAEFVLSVSAASSLVVLRTAPGHAAAVARAIDLAAPDHVVGTIAGDDTIFVATPSVDAAAVVAASWAHEENVPDEAAG